MSGPLLSLYHRLPGPLRSAAATLRGAYLRHWRYGAASEHLVSEALERDTWSPDRLRAWRDERLAAVLHRAATRVPYYREYWADRRRRGDTASWEVLEHWPLVEKDALRAAPQAFVADDRDPRKMFHEQTSGTTGLPLHIWRTRETVTALYALATARTRRWHDIPEGVAWARIGGQLVTPAAQREPPFWVWNAAMRQLYLSAYHLAPDLLPHYLDALARYRVTYLAGYSSSLHALAQSALETGRTDLRMTAAFTNAEPLTEDQRRNIGAAFHCAARETYGMAETVAAASECPAGRMHQWPEVGHFEVIDEDGGPADQETTGELVCTGLLNADMPLIRYRVGDRGRLGDQTPCPCGRTLPHLAAVEGRTTDVLYTEDGRRVFWLNPVFYGLPVRESQIVQESLRRVRVFVAPAPGFGTEHRTAVTMRLRERLGPVDVRVDLVDSVPRSANAKVRAVVCQIQPSEREAVLRRATVGV